MPLRLSLLGCCVCALSCASNETDFAVRFAPGFAPPRHAVSIFGVYKDGQMSAEAWDSLAPRLASWIGSVCIAGYVDGATAKTNGPLWSAVDEYTRSNGPTDDLLSELAPAAQGDLVMVVTVAGKVPADEKNSLPAESSAASPSMSGGGAGGMGGMGGMGAGMRGAPPRARHDKMMPAGSKDALDLAALFYSPSAKTSVAEISLEYTGHHLDDALAQFTGKLREVLPGASCASWTWDGKVDPERVRKIGEGER